MIEKENQDLFRLTCEYQAEPLGIQNDKPRFGWQLPEGYSMQKAFRIRVSEEGGEGCIWDSSWRGERRCQAVAYEGEPLESRKRYRWELELELVDGQRMDRNAWFETGILKTEEWEAKWIQSPQPKQRQSVQMIRQFQLEKMPRRARVYISGIGYYELYLNGQKVGNRVLEPGWTDYRKRVLYSVYDVGDLLLEGENTLGICLGDGWYANRHEGFRKLMGNYPVCYGVPKAICELAFWEEEGLERKILTEGGAQGGWLVSNGPILENNVYDGEVYDGRLEEGWTQAGFEPGGQWQPALEAAPWGCVLTAQVMPPIRPVREYRPVYIAYAPQEDCGGSQAVVADFGQNIAGWARIRVQGQAGQKVRLRYGEVLDARGGVEQRNLRNARAEDCYILKGGEIEEYAPRFTYHGFRYVELLAEEGVVIFEVAAVAVHTDVEQTGSFSGSSRLLNQIQQAMVMTELNNLHSIPTDCPQRDERMAWLNDMTVRFEEALFNFDMILFYEKWLDDIADAQNPEQGSIPDTAPHVFGGSDACHISSVYVLLPWFLYLFYGDSQPLKKHYSGMKRYVMYKLGQREKNGLLPERYFGEWAPPMTECQLGWGENAVPARIPAPLVTTCYLCYDCRVMAKAASLLEKEAEAAQFEAWARECAEAVNRAYFNEEKGYYEPNIQGSNVFPLYLGIVPEGHKGEVLGHLLENLRERDYHVTTGNQLTKYLFEVLRQEGYHEEAFRIASQRTYPSIGYMLSCGATTIWERWENMAGNAMNSHDHPMLGAFTVWFYKALAGIQDEEGLAGTIRVKPAVVPQMEFAAASCRTPGGILKSSWERQGEGVEFRIHVPWNTQVQLELPEGYQPEYSEEYQPEPSEGCGMAAERGLLLPSGEHCIRYRQIRYKEVSGTGAMPKGAPGPGKWICPEN